MLENLWIYGEYESGSLATRKIGIVIAETKSEALRKVLEMYCDFGCTDAELENFLVWRALDAESHDSDYPDVIEFVY